jgi:hypothetical protein
MLTDFRIFAMKNISINVIQLSVVTLNLRH